MSSSRKDALKKSRQMDTHRQMDSSLSFPVLRLQGSPRHLNSGPQHSPSPSLQDSTNPRTYWNTVLSQSSPSESASAPRPRPSEAGSSTQPVNFELDPNFKAYGMSSSLNRKRSNCLGLMIDPVPDTRRSTASRPFGCHLCKGRFERIGHLNVRVPFININSCRKDPVVILYWHFFCSSFRIGPCWRCSQCSSTIQMPLWALR